MAKRPRPKALKKKPREQVEALVRSLGKFLLDIGVSDCEPLDGEIDIRVRPIKGCPGEVTFSYRTMARWCCNCISDQAGCGDCIMARGQPGVIQKGTVYGDTQEIELY